MSHTHKIFKNCTPFRDLQMILLPFSKISSHIKLRKMSLSSGIQGQWSTPKLKNMIIVKDPQFLFIHHETWSKWLTHEYKMLPEYQPIWREIVDFLEWTSFWVWAKFFVTVSMYWISPELLWNSTIVYTLLARPLG